VIIEQDGVRELADIVESALGTGFLRFGYVSLPAGRDNTANESDQYDSSGSQRRQCASGADGRRGRRR